MVRVIMGPRSLPGDWVLKVFGLQPYVGIGLKALRGSFVNFWATMAAWVGRFGIPFAMTER
jgi:hypothetical protein